MNPVIVIIAIILALLGGLILGWFVGGKPTKNAVDAADALRITLDGVRDERDAARIERGALATELAANKAAQAEKDKAQDEKIASLEQAHSEKLADLKSFNEQARQQLSEQFSSVGGKLLGDAQKQFLERAEQRFSESEKTNEAKIRAIMEPVGEKLKLYEEKVESIEQDRKKDFGSIETLMHEVKLGQEAVRAEATNIVNSLTVAPKSGGRWGEQQFKNLLELAGLTEHIDFESEVSSRDDDGSILRPDFLIRLPGNRELIVDIKCPLEAYKSAISEGDPALKKAHFKRHSKAVRGHASALSKKSYWAQFPKAPDFVILYIPGDNFLSAALEYDQKVWQEYADRRVVISGPATFLPLARTISMMWSREGLADKANEVLEVGKDLHLNLSIMSDRIRKLGTDMEKSMHSYNSVIKSFDGRVASKAKRFEELGLHQSDKAIGDFSSVDQIAAPIVRLQAQEKESANDGE